MFWFFTIISLFISSVTKSWWITKGTREHFLRRNERTWLKLHSRLEPMHLCKCRVFAAWWKQYTDDSNKQDCIFKTLFLQFPCLCLLVKQIVVDLQYFIFNNSWMRQWMCRKVQIFAECFHIGLDLPPFGQYLERRLNISFFLTICQ